MSDALTRVGTILLTVVLTSAICIAMYYNDNMYHEGSPQAIDGLLTVEQGSLDAYPVFHLVSGWAFYPNVLLTPKDFADENPAQRRIYTAIGERTRFHSAGDPADRYGGGTYLLQMRLPKKIATYALEVPEIYSACARYINDRLVLQMKAPELGSYTPRTQNRVVTFEASEQARILIAISGGSNVHGGMVHPPAFGTPLAVNTMRGLRMGIALFVGTIALLAAVLSLYFGLQLKHQNAKLFSLLCMVMCLFTLDPLLHSALVLPVFPWYAVKMTFGYLLSLPLLILHNRICGVDRHVGRVSVAAASVVCGIVLCHGLWSTHLTVPVVNVFSAILLCFKLAAPSYLLATGFLALYAGKNEDVKPLLYASIVCATTLVWDCVFPAFEPVIGGQFTEWGSLALVWAIGDTLWRDITTAYSSSIFFAQEHRMMTRQLAMQSEYASQMQKSNESNQRLTHDFRHQLRILQSLCAQIECTPEMERSKQELISNITLSSHDLKPSHRNVVGQFSKNVTADALLQYYFTAAGELGVRMDIAFALPESFPLPDAELCTMLGNLLENAVDACLRYESDGKYIQIISKCTQRFFVLLIINSYDGNCQKTEGRILSRKPGEVRFGVGLESVRYTVERYGGSLNVFPDGNRFCVRISLRLK